MRVPVSWLKEFVKLGSDITIQDLHEAFVSLGFEVEGIETFGAVEGDLKVGEVIEIKNLDQFKKPIRFCQIKIGKDVRGIICGATNFDVGDKVVVALPGAVLPGGFKITARKTYDHLSDGMICSESELGISDSHSGILTLNKSVPSGIDAKKLLGLGESVFELSVLPDRGYALSMRGIAREIAGYFNKNFEDPVKNYRPVKEKRGVTKAKIIAGNKASHFTLVTLSGVNPNATTPEFIKQRLSQMGMRAISLPVDVTNYVMVEFGQPLHAFDRKKVKGAISVRQARKNEKIKTLDGVVRTLLESDLVISDSEKAISIAGIMGGANSEISEKTKQIVLEAANFDAASISKTARRLGLTSEASKRFERVCDPLVAEAAARRAAELLVEFGDGEILGASTKKSLYKPKSIKLKFHEVEQISGLRIRSKEIIKSLQKIGCTVRVLKDGLIAKIPSWRSDLENQNDLTEEILRLHGYWNIVGKLPGAISGKGLTQKQKIKRDIGHLLAGAGAHEVLNYPFSKENEFNTKLLANLNSKFDMVKIANPMNELEPFLRISLLPGLLDTLQRNISRGNENVSIFEIGQVFINKKNISQLPMFGSGFAPNRNVQREIDAALPIQKTSVGAVFTAEHSRSGWWGSGLKHSIHSTVEIVVNLFNQIGFRVRVENKKLDWFHPGRSGQIFVEDNIIGYIGQIHPKIANGYGVKEAIYAFEFDLSLLLNEAKVSRKYQEIGVMPFALEDLALVVDSSVSAYQLQDAIVRAGAPVLESVNLFDIYQAAPFGPTKKSLTYRLRFRAEDKTLTSEDLGQIRERILRRVKNDFGAALRQ